MSVSSVTWLNLIPNLRFRVPSFKTSETLWTRHQVTVILFELNSWLLTPSDSFSLLSLLLLGNAQLCLYPYVIAALEIPLSWRVHSRISSQTCSESKSEDPVSVAFFNVLTHIIPFLVRSTHLYFPTIRRNVEEESESRHYESTPHLSKRKASLGRQRSRIHSSFNLE